MLFKFVNLGRKDEIIFRGDRWPSESKSEGGLRHKLKNIRMVAFPVGGLANAVCELQGQNSENQGNLYCAFPIFGRGQQSQSPSKLVLKLAQLHAL